MFERGAQVEGRRGRSIAERLKARLWSSLSAAAAGLFLCTLSVGQTTATPEVLSLKLYHIHTGEKATIVFKRNGVYDQAGLAQLNEFVRDWRKNQPTNMDPHLFDLLWQVYQQSGSHDYIHIVCGYRSPDTNNMLRRRSRGVAKNSLHMQGKAMDFFIPDVPLAKLRAIGLRMQIGGVGFYPTSGSPFVHMDTGTVRHWPRMTRQELVAIFPNGRTLHVPSDGKPLPGYAEALADYKARKAAGGAIASFAVADAGTTVQKTVVSTKPIQLASADNADDDEDSIDAAADAPATAVAADAPAARKSVAAVAAYATVPVPIPNLAPRRTTTAVVVADAAPALPVPPAAVGPAVKPNFVQLATLTTRNTSLAPDFDFGSPQDWSAPAVPAALAKAMAERDQLRRGASLPIAPTAVVATIDVNRPLRAEAITTAVLRSSNEPIETVPRVLAYADADPMPIVKPRVASAIGGMPLPQLRPRPDATRTAVAKVRPATVRPHMDAPDLMMTSLDTQGLRMWIGPQSTRQKTYALLTMPDFGQMPELMSKPSVTYGAGFGQTAYANLRTDRFTGPLVQQPRMIDLTVEPLIASVR